MKNKLLYTGSEWNMELIERLWSTIKQVNKETFGFDHYVPQIEVISAEQMLDAYSSVAMPVMYNHWSFGKTFLQNERQYNKGMQGLAYEVVINTNPCLTYLMENNCVDAETEYLSRTGWKKITEFKGEEVLGYNNDGTANFILPKEYIVSKNTEPMIKIKAKGIDQVVTQNHRVIYIKRNGQLGEMLAKDVKHAHENLSRGWDGRILTSFEYQSESKIDMSDAEIRLTCAVNADGCFPGKGTYCRFGFKKQEKIERLLNILAECKLEYRISTENKKGTTHISCHPPLKTKRFDNSWYKASTEQLRIISEEVFYWDADLTKNNAYYSNSKEDADFIQFACNSVGKSATIRKTPTCYSVYKSECSLRNVSEFSEQFEDMSYCFKMPSTMWVARRNNKVFVTGNTATLQALVISHASIGHSCFFKTNYLFKGWTDADSIIDYLRFAKNYIKTCEDKYGADRVEKLLDACHALQSHGIDKYKKPSSLGKELSAQRKKQWENYFETSFNDLHRTTNKKSIDVKEFKEERIGEENILYFIEKNSPILEEWEKEIVRIVRKIAQYFYPQRQTQLLNEGTATFIHYHIMTELHDQGYIDEGAYLEFLENHTNVVTQRDWDSKYYSGINVYALGFAMLMDVKRACLHPDAEDRKWLPHVCGTDWLTTIKDIIANYRDESFILQYLSPKVARQFKLFSVHIKEGSGHLLVNGTHDDDDFRAVKQSLAEQYDLSRSVPQIEVVKVDWKGDRWLYLEHKTKNNQRLDYSNMKKTVAYINKLWGFPVKIDYVDLDGNELEEI